MSQANEEAERQTAPEDVVPFPSKLAYGAGAFVNNLLSAAIGNMMIVLNLGFGMNPALVGALGGLPRIVDAITDPLMGHISDNTRSRWGRRRPYIFVGAIVVAVVFVMLWQMPIGDTHVVTWGQDGVARQWNADRGEVLDTLSHDGQLQGAAFSDDSKRLLAWTDGAAQLWNVETVESTQTFQHGGLSGATLRGEEVLTWGQDGSVRRWNTETGAIIGEPTQHDGTVLGLTLDGGRILTWGADGTARLWSDGSDPLSIRHQGVSGAAINGDRILTWGADGTARMWSASTGEALAPALPHDQPVNGAMVRGAEILTWSGDAARVWRAKDGKLLAGPMAHDGPVVGAAFYKQSHVVTWSEDGTARLWDRAEGTPAAQQMSHEGPILGLIIDEDHLLSWSEDGTARLWEAETGASIGEAMQHDGAITGVRLNRPRTRILSWSEDGTARLWHPDTGASIGTPITLDGPVLGAVFNDGHMEDFYFWWFLVGSVLFFIAYTMWATPWVALGFELTPDYYERTRLMGVQFFIGQLPYLVAPWFLAFMTWSIFTSQAQGARVLAMIVAAVAMCLGVIPAIFLRERPLPPTEESSEPSGGILSAIWTFLRAMALTMTSGPFLVLCAATFLVFNGFQLIASFQSYVLIYYVMGGDQAAGADWLGYVGTTQIFATMGVIPFVTWLANRIGKRRAFLFSTAIATVGYGLKWFCYSQTTPWLILLPTPLIAFSLGGLFTLMPSMIADVVDHDELRSHQRREGMFGSVYWLMVKLGVSVALIAGGILLNETGFKVELGADQSVETLLWLRIYDVIVPMVTSILAMAAMYFYPLVESRALQIRAELDARHAAAEAAAT